MQLFQHSAALALPHVRLFRREILRAVIQGRRVRAGIVGQADLWGVVQGGLHLELEIKALGGALSHEQILWRDWCLRSRVPWALLEPREGETPEATVERWVDEVRLLASPP